MQSRVPGNARPAAALVVLVSACAPSAPPSSRDTLRPPIASEWVAVGEPALPRVDGAPFDHVDGTWVLHVGDSFVGGPLAASLAGRFEAVGAREAAVAKQSTSTFSWAEDPDLDEWPRAKAGPGPRHARGERGRQRGAGAEGGGHPRHRPQSGGRGAVRVDRPGALEGGSFGLARCPSRPLRSMSLLRQRRGAGRVAPRRAAPGRHSPERARRGPLGGRALGLARGAPRSRARRLGAFALCEPLIGAASSPSGTGTFHDRRNGRHRERNRPQKRAMTLPAMQGADAAKRHWPAVVLVLLAACDPIAAAIAPSSAAFPNSSTGPEPDCEARCAARATACREDECRRGCNLILDRLVERLGEPIVACVAGSRSRCDDRVWAACAVRVGPHADGGPPAPPPPDDDPAVE